MTVAYIHHPTCLLHDMGAGHPEQPARLTAIHDRLVAAGIEPLLATHEARPAERAQLERVHSGSHIERVFAAAPTEGLRHLDGDTALCPHSLEAALLAAGGNAQAVDMVMAGEAKRAFCAVRPPGHHAERDAAMGFCLFNNAAVAAAHALEGHDLERVAVLDFDVHHGNGTEDIFSGDSRVLFCSTFQHPFYPGSGHDTRVDNIVNTPLPAGAGAPEFRAAVEGRWLPALRRFKPQLIVVSAGFDAHTEDFLAHLNLVDADYEWVTRKICAVADECAKGRVVSTLEGGYALPALARSAALHIKAML